MCVHMGFVCVYSLSPERAEQQSRERDHIKSRSVRESPIREDSRRSRERDLCCCEWRAAKRHEGCVCVSLSVLSVRVRGTHLRLASVGGAVRKVRERPRTHPFLRRRVSSEVIGDGGATFARRERSPLLCRWLPGVHLSLTRRRARRGSADSSGFAAGAVHLGLAWLGLRLLQRREGMGWRGGSQRREQTREGWTAPKSGKAWRVQGTEGACRQGARRREQSMRAQACARSLCRCVRVDKARARTDRVEAASAGAGAAPTATEATAGGGATAGSGAEAGAAACIGAAAHTGAATSGGIAPPPNPSAAEFWLAAVDCNTPTMVCASLSAVVVPSCAAARSRSTLPFFCAQATTAEVRTF